MTMNEDRLYITEIRGNGGNEHIRKMFVNRIKISIDHDRSFGVPPDDTWDNLPKIFRGLVRNRTHKAARQVVLTKNDVEYKKVYREKWSKTYAQIKKHEIEVAIDRIERQEFTTVSKKHVCYNVMLPPKDLGDRSDWAFIDDAKELKITLQKTIKSIQESLATKGIKTDYMWHMYMVGTKWIARVILFFSSDFDMARKVSDKFLSKRLEKFSINENKSLLEKFSEFLFPLLKIDYEDDYILRAQSILWLHGIQHWYHSRGVAQLIPTETPGKKRSTDGEDTENEKDEKKVYLISGPEEHPFFQDLRQMSRYEFKEWKSEFGWEWITNLIRERLGKKPVKSRELPPFALPEPHITDFGWGGATA